MFTSILFYFIGGAITGWGASKVLSNIPESKDSSSNTSSTSSTSYEDTLGADGESWGMPYTP